MPVWLTRVRSHSMAPTLRDGRLYWTRRVRPTTTVRRGDLVVVDADEVAVPVVKRVVGLPGEHLAFRAGRVSIDGRLLDEPYATASWYDGDFHVPGGHYVVLGDNRDASTDSRTWRQPYVTRAAITGRLLRGAAQRRPSG